MHMLDCMLSLQYERLCNVTTALETIALLAKAVPLPHCMHLQVAQSLRRSTWMLCKRRTTSRHA